MAWGALIGAGASLLGSYLGSRGNKYTPQYLDPGKVRSEMLEGTGEQRANLDSLYRRGAMSGDRLSGGARSALGYGRGFLDQAQGLMGGTSPILQAMRQQQAQQLGDIGGQQMMQQNQALSARGMGGGGLSNILGMKTTSAMGEQARQGLLGIQQYGLQAGQGFGQLGGQMFGQAAGLGQAASGAYAGARGTQQDVLQLQTGANTAAANQMAANFEAQQKYQAQQAAQKSAFGGQMGGLIGKGIATAAMMSDRRMKRDIIKVGTLDSGLPVYTYRLKGDSKYQMGVMAQELEKTQPENVLTVDGIKYVNYKGLS
jgi:hypothetical protein